MSKKTLYFDSYSGYITSAITENGKLIEFNFEKKDDGGIVGNIYKGKVEKILPGMNAAFIDCGLERNCYLSDEDAFPDGDGYDAEGRFIPPLPDFKEGDEIIVQVTKAPVGKKGARVSAHPRIVGKYLIYMPETPVVGISRKIADDELRHNLIYSTEKLKEKSEGLIVRTAAPYAKRNQVEIEYEYLKNLYCEIKRKASAGAIGELLYAEAALPIRVLRDILAADIDKIIVGNATLGGIITDIINLYPSHSRMPVSIHNTGRDMLDEYGISEQIAASLSTRAELKNGGYLVIEKTEALTVIDVNTGKFTGDSCLEQTVYYTNSLAAREIARQVRLRNIGGIVVVDFIDMKTAAHRNAVVEELERALRNDRAKCSVSPMSEFGLVEFTRKRIGCNMAARFAKPCRECNGNGRTLSAEFIIFRMRAKILNLIHDGAKEIRLDVNDEVCTRLLEWREMLDDLKTHCADAHICAVPHRSYRFEQYTLTPAPFTYCYNAVQIV